MDSDTRKENQEEPKIKILGLPHKKDFALLGVHPPLSSDVIIVITAAAVTFGRGAFGIQGNDHFLTVARYVEGNPVRAGLVGTAADWVWSSHRERCGLESENLVTSFPVPFIGDWTEFVNTPMTPAELAKSRKLIIRQKCKSEENELIH